MAKGNILDESISKMVKRYSSLFPLPSHKKIVVLLFSACMLGGVLAILPLFPPVFGLALGLAFGSSLFFLTLLADYLASGCMKRDPIFNLRRCSALSVYSIILWFGFIFLGSAVSVFLRSVDVWVKLFLLGFCAVLILRSVVFFTMSFVNTGRVFVSSLLQPMLCIIPVFLMRPLIGYSLGVSFFFLLLSSVFLALLTVFFFTSSLDRIGKKTLSISSFSLFKAFMANWTENLNEPLESFFEKLGSEQDIRLSLLALRAKKRMKAMIVVSGFHPGPFKNVGSSLLPYIIQNTLESKLHCTVSVPHGLFGHDFDLSSQLQNQKIVEGVLNSVDFPFFHAGATPFVRVEKDVASASCQIFGDCAFFTLTVAPKTTEDLPKELDSVIAEEAEKHGLSSSMVVNAHNSIDGSCNPYEMVGGLKQAAVTSLGEALARQRSPFQVGASSVVPKEFSVEDGMGPGGISVIVTKVGAQKAAYITIDGNNMVSGLREKILSTLGEMGIVEGEVLTTDTHVVNGVVMTERGYHPVGEAMDQAKLIDYIRQAVSKALDSLEPVEVAWRTETIPNVKVIGEKAIGAMCLLTEKMVSQAKKLAVSIFSAVGAILIALLVLL